MKAKSFEASPDEERVLVLAPTGRDGAILVQSLAANGLQAWEFRNLRDVAEAWDAGAGVLLLAEEALSRHETPAFLEKLARQPPWSDIPIVIVTGGGNIGSTRLAALDTFAPAGNVSFLERPFRKATLLSVLQVALRARRRQYQLRENLESLRKGEERLRLAINAGGIAVWEWDVARRRFACTDKLEEFAGVAHGGFGGTLEGFAAFLHPSDSRAFLEAVGQAARSKEEFEILLRLRGPDDAVRWLNCRAQPIPGGDGEVIRVVGAAADISEHLRAAEELRKTRESLLQAQKMEAIGKLAGGIAHDFNNMLTAINGYSEILLPRAKGDPDLETGLKEILNSGRRAAALTQQLLAYSRQQVMNLKPMDINAAVGSMAGMLKRLISEDINLVFELGSELPPIRADLSQLEQIILNLALNARDAISAGGRIRIATDTLKVGADDAGAYPEVEPGRYVRMSVSDNGIGMSAETRQRIFDPFFTTKEQGKGTGMGLPTVYGIVKQSAGHILVESEPGKGTTIAILFPASSGSFHPSRASDPAKAGEVAGKETILVAEDEEAVRNFIALLLKAAGYQVLSAGSGEAALELSGAFRDPIHLLLTDVVMPGINGRELADRLAASRPGIKVIFVSGYTDDAILKHGVLDEDRAFLNKPFTPAALLDKIRSILKGEPLTLKDA